MTNGGSPHKKGVESKTNTKASEKVVRTMVDEKADVAAKAETVKEKPNQGDH